jgi:aminoglycoside phosphotransferase (APT) family kinase protein
MPFVEGHVLTSRLPAGLDTSVAPQRIADELADRLAELHSISYKIVGLADFGRPDGYLERQIKRFSGLLELNATRPLPQLERVEGWLFDNMPISPPPTIVHGDYRLGNVMFGLREPCLVAVLDWEMATVGDPLADLGYMTAMWVHDSDPPNPVGDLSAVTRLPGFPPGEGLARRYAAASGVSLDSLVWYQTLALWKAAIFLEGGLKRYQAGTTRDPYYASLSGGIEQLGRLALAHAGLSA